MHPSQPRQLPIAFVYLPLSLLLVYLTEISTSGPTEPGGLNLHDKSSPMLKSQSEIKRDYITGYKNSIFYNELGSYTMFVLHTYTKCFHSL